MHRVEMKKSFWWETMGVGDYYIGLDVHKKSITYVIKTNEGTLVRWGSATAAHRGPSPKTAHVVAQPKTQLHGFNNIQRFMTNMG